MSDKYSPGKQSRGEQGAEERGLKGTERETSPSPSRLFFTLRCQQQLAPWHPAHAHTCLSCWVYTPSIPSCNKSFLPLEGRQLKRNIYIYIFNLLTQCWQSQTKHNKTNLLNHHFQCQRAYAGTFCNKIYTHQPERSSCIRTQDVLTQRGGQYFSILSNSVAYFYLNNTFFSSSNHKCHKYRKKGLKSLFQPLL